MSMVKKSAKEIAAYLEEVKGIDAGSFTEYAKEGWYFDKAAIKAMHNGWVVPISIWKGIEGFEQVLLGKECKIFDGDDIISSKNKPELKLFEESLKNFLPTMVDIEKEEEPEPSKKTEKVKCHLDKKTGKVTVNLQSGVKEFKSMDEFNLWKEGIETSREVIVSHKDDKAGFQQVHGGSPTKLNVMHLVFDEKTKTDDKAGMKDADNIDLEAVKGALIKLDSDPAVSDKVAKMLGVSVDEMEEIAKKPEVVKSFADIKNLSKAFKKAGIKNAKELEDEKKLEAMIFELIKIVMPKFVKNEKKAMTMVDPKFIHQYITKESLDKVLNGVDLQVKTKIFKAINRELEFVLKGHKEKFEHKLDLGPNSNPNLLLFGYGDVRWGIAITGDKSWSQFFRKDVNNEELERFLAESKKKAEKAASKKVA